MNPSPTDFFCFCPGDPRDLRLRATHGKELISWHHGHQMNHGANVSVKNPNVISGIIERITIPKSSIYFEIINSTIMKVFGCLVGAMASECQG